MGETDQPQPQSPTSADGAATNPPQPPQPVDLLARGIARAQRARLLSRNSLPQQEQTGDPEVDAVLTAVVSAEQHDQAQGAQQLARLAAQDLLAFAGPAPAGSAP